MTVYEDNSERVQNALSGEALLALARIGGGVIQIFARMNASAGRPGLNVVTGALVNSIQVFDGESSETRAEVEVGPTVEYGAIHEFGGVIMPVFAKMLSWVDNGVRIFAKMVQIPARPYMRPAVDEHQEDILNAVAIEAKNQIEKATS
jgi:phage gpG-like protein